MNYRQIRVLLVLFSLIQIMDLKAQDFLSSLFTIEAGANYYRIPIGNEQWISGITPSLGARYDLRPNKTFGYGIGMTYSPRLDREKTKLGNVHNFYIDFSLSGSWYPKNKIYLDLGLQRSFLLARNYSENNNTTPIDPPRSHYAITTGAGVNMLKNSRLLMRYSIPVDFKGYRNVQVAFLFNLHEFRRKQKNHITSLDQAFENPCVVEKLVLHQQNLPVLPPEIGKLTNLRELILDGSRLKSLPEEIGELNQLVKLSAKFNEIKKLPDSIGALTMLEELHLDYNSMYELPPQIGALENLKFLYLSNNNLTKIPPEIGKLTKLVELDVSNNAGLLQLPLEISNLKNLEKLYISPTTIFPIPFIPPNARLEIIVVEPGSPQINLYRR
jgi:hypothetical protein